MIKGVIVTHSSLGSSLIDTARSVVGDFENVIAISNANKTPRDLAEEIRAAAGSNGPCVIFVDFEGGSCSHACLHVVLERADTAVISGVNLPMLLAFLNKRDTVPFESLPKEILDRSHNSVRILDPGKM